VTRAQGLVGARTVVLLNLAVMSFGSLELPSLLGTVETWRFKVKGVTFFKADTNWIADTRNILKFPSFPFLSFSGPGSFTA